MILFTCTWAEAPYISHDHVTVFPSNSLPVDLVNQNIIVIAGSIKALKTSSTGFLTSIWVSTMGGFISFILSRLNLGILYVFYYIPAYLASMWVDHKMPSILNYYI